MKTVKPLTRTIEAEGFGLKRAPQGILFGDVGSGKTTALLQAFSHWDIYAPDPTSLGRAEALGIIPKRAIELVDEYEEDDKGTILKTPRWDKWFLELHMDMARRSIARRKKLTDAGKDPSTVRPLGYVMTDASEMWEWIYRDICAAIPAVGRGMFRRIDRVKFIATRAIKIAKKYNFGLIWEMHSTERTFVEMDASIDAALQPNVGAVKWPAGPKFPVGSMIRGVTRKMDFVHLLMTEGETTKLITRKPDDEEAPIIKTRRQCEMEYELTEKYTFRDVLAELKFHV